MNQEVVAERLSPETGVEVSNGDLGLSVVVPVTERFDPPEAVYEAYRDGVAATGRSYEFIYVLDGHYPEVLAALTALKQRGEPIKIIKFARWFGEATALNVATAHAQGEVILTLPAYRQVEASEIPRLLEALDDCDMAVGRRWPRTGSWFNALQSKMFHILVQRLLETPLGDLGCGARAFKRQVMSELHVYGDQHRFLPLLAERQGFTVREVDLAQDPADRAKRVYSPGTYVRRILDVLTVFFLVKFTRKPLRFFGLIGLSVLAVGSVLTVYLGVERLFFGVGLADRPALILGTLMVVLGIQIIAVGLIGEIVIFTRAKDLKEYKVDEIIE